MSYHMYIKGIYQYYISYIYTSLYTYSIWFDMIKMLIQAQLIFIQTAQRIIIDADALNMNETIEYNR